MEWRFAAGGTGTARAWTRATNLRPLPVPFLPDNEDLFPNTGPDVSCFAPREEGAPSSGQ